MQNSTCVGEYIVSITRAYLFSFAIKKRFEINDYCDDVIIW